jgi:hypothetical protein
MSVSHVLGELRAKLEEKIMERTELKEFVEELRIEWKDLWRNKLDDKVRAEGIAKQNYSKLFVDRGTVIMATRDFKPIDFFDIVERHFGSEAQKATPPNSTIGGWGKFIRTNIRKQKIMKDRRNGPLKPTPKKCQQQKKGGRGWLHANLL